MINTLKPGTGQGHDAQRGEILERISREYGKPEEKQREAVKKLGKDEFFKIMVTQIQHQDPLKPAQNEQMAAQMAQFSALEQMINMNQALDRLTQSQQPLHNLGATGLIGKFVTADSSRIFHTEGKYSDVKFELPADAKSVRIMIVNERGENVREIESKDLKKGSVSIPWDGRKENNMAAPSGQYMVQISALTEKDQSIPIQTLRTERVHGVAYEGKDTVLLVGDVTKPSKLMLKNVSKVVDAAQVGSPGFQSGGMQFNGLENLIKGETEGEVENEGASPVEPQAALGPSDAQIAQMLNQMDRPAPQSVSSTQASKFAPVDVAAMRKAQEKPAIMPKPTSDDINRALADAQDLSAANPVAASIAHGKQLPSGEEGSTAGKWSE